MASLKDRTEQISKDFGRKVKGSTIAAGTAIKGGVGNVAKLAGKSINSAKRSLAGMRPEFEQHIAVFGQSGSGKTTLLTVFFGYQQSPDFIKTTGYRIIAEDTTQSNRLLESYFQLTQKSVQVTHVASQKYCFKVQYDANQLVAFQRAKNKSNTDVAKITWNDYPGEWWTETEQGPIQADKEETFLSLLASDVALLLVDGEKLKDDGIRYLKKLFCSFRNELAVLKIAPSINSKLPLTHFPRTWFICLSKADLLPEMTVEDFRKLILENAGEDLEAVRDEIKTMITEPDQFNLGNDYLLLSVAQYEGEKITDLTKKRGVDLIAPITFTVPIEHAYKSAKKGGKTYATASKMVESFRKLSTGWLKWLPLVGYYFSLLDDLMKGAVENFDDKKSKALQKGYLLDAILIAFQEKLVKARDRDVIIQE